MDKRDKKIEIIKKGILSGNAEKMYKGYVCPNIPSNKISKAITSYAVGADSGNVLGLIQFSHGGALFTESSIYYKVGKQSGYKKYSEKGNNLTLITVDRNYRLDMPNNPDIVMNINSILSKLYEVDKSTLRDYIEDTEGKLNKGMEIVEDIQELAGAAKELYNAVKPVVKDAVDASKPVLKKAGQKAASAASAAVNKVKSINANKHNK